MSRNTPLFALCAALFLFVTTPTAAADIVASLDTKTPCEKPAYPRASLVNEEAGVVTLGLLIGADGRVVESKIEKSSGFKNLDRAASTALVKCRFKSAMKDGKPEQVWMKIEYVWKLD